MKVNPYIEAGKAIEEFAEAFKKAKEESRLFRILLWWDDLKFDIKMIFKGEAEIFTKLRWWFWWKFVGRLRRIFKRKL